MRESIRAVADLTWVSAEVDVAERCVGLSPNPLTLWLTGLSGSG